MGEALGGLRRTVDAKEVGVDMKALMRDVREGRQGRCRSSSSDILKCSEISNSDKSCPWSYDPDYDPKYGAITKQPGFPIERPLQKKKHETIGVMGVNLYFSTGCSFVGFRNSRLKMAVDPPTYSIQLGIIWVGSL